MSQDKLDALLAPLVKEATVLDPIRSSDAEDASVDSKFGGEPYAQVDDAWPNCPTCKNELVFVAQFREEDRDELFAFFYCFECFPWGLADEAKGQWIIRRYKNPSMTQYKRIAPSKTNECSPIPCMTRSRIVRVLPDWEGLESSSVEAENLCCEIDEDSPWEEYSSTLLRNRCLDEYATLVGGYPRWVQGETVNHCSICGGKLQFLAQIDSEDTAGLMWGDVGLIYLFQCKNHPDEFHLELQCH